MASQVKQIWLFNTTGRRFVKSFSTVYCITTDIPDNAYRVHGTKDYAEGVAMILSLLCTPVTAQTYARAMVNYKKAKL